VDQKETAPHAAASRWPVAEIRRTIGDLDLRGRTLQEPLDLTATHVTGTVDLSGAVLEAGLTAKDAWFDRPVNLHRCRISGDLFAAGARFDGGLDMSWARCRGRLYFWRARFGGPATFFQLQCHPHDRPEDSFVHPGEFNCSWAWFRGPADFGRCHLYGPAYFWRTRFFDRCSFDEASFASDAVFAGTRSEICLARDELPPDVFERLDVAGFLSADSEESCRIEGRTLYRYAQLRGIASAQQLDERIDRAALSEADAQLLREAYREHSGPMFGGQAILSRLRIPQPKSVKFFAVNADSWSLDGTDLDAIAFFDSAERPVPAAIGLGHSYHSVFISYGGPDTAEALRINAALTNAGVETFFYPEDAVPGVRIEAEMEAGVGRYDRTLLLCSETSHHRRGWLFEAHHALDLERRDGGTRLIPVTLDEGLWSWQPADTAEKDLRQMLLDRTAADFRRTAGNEDAFNTAIAKLLVALTKPPADEAPVTRS
jgi:hypothetical protein